MCAITASTLVEDIVQDFVWAVGWLAKKGIVCIQCGEPVWGTLAEAARRAGITDIDSLVEELNRMRKNGLI